jgi:hypothetical protein
MSVFTNTRQIRGAFDLAASDTIDARVRLRCWSFGVPEAHAIHDLAAEDDSSGDMPRPRVVVAIRRVARGAHRGAPEVVV